MKLKRKLNLPQLRGCIILISILAATILGSQGFYKVLYKVYKVLYKDYKNKSLLHVM